MKYEHATRWESIRTTSPMRTVVLTYETVEVPELSLVIPFGSGRYPRSRNLDLYRDVRDHCKANDIPIFEISHWDRNRTARECLEDGVHLIVCESVGDQANLKTVFPDLR